MVEMVRKYLTVTSINNCNKVSQRVDIFPEQVFSDCLLSYTYDLSSTTLMQSHRMPSCIHMVLLQKLKRKHQ